VNRYAGTATLAKLIVRRDRTRLVLWAYVIAGLIASTAYSFHSLYPTREGLATFGASVASNPTLLAVDGPIFSTDTLGGLTAWRVGGIAAVFIAIMSVLTVVRHTRTEEESGRTELVSAGVVGRLAPLTAALLVVGVADLVIGAAVVVIMVSVGAGTAGSIALGAGVAAGGLMFAAVAAVAAQLTDGARAANGIGMAVLGLAFLLRALGDSSPHLGAVSWLSPIGWTQQVRPYAHERWWVFAVIAAFALLLVLVTYQLVNRRDVGAGLFPSRLGPATAGRGLRGALGLAWRLHRGSLYGWAAGFVVIGAVYGGAAKSVADLLKTSSQLQQILNRLGGQAAVTDAYFASIFGLTGLVAAAYGIQAMLRARGEETAMRAEPLLATATSRPRYAGVHLLFALAGTAVMLVAAGLGAGVAYAAATHDGGQVGRLTVAALAQWPAAVVLAGAAATLFGLLPGWTTVAWGLLGAFFVLGEIGPVVKLPQAVMDVSPFTHTPHLPGPIGDAAQPLVLLTLIAVVLIAAGFAGFRRRDIG
jgi:ABC-2 type transport system permease protein